AHVVGLHAEYFIKFAIPIAAAHGGTGRQDGINLARLGIVTARPGETLAGPQFIADETIAAVHKLLSTGLHIAKQPREALLVDLIVELPERADDEFNIVPAFVDEPLGLAMNRIDQAIRIGIRSRDLVGHFIDLPIVV